MKENKAKKELITQYKEREIIGGIYAIKNMQNSKLLLGAVTDLHSYKNRFEFSQKTGSCIDCKLQNDWREQGGEQFVFEVLETLNKNKTQTDKEFKADIDLLKEMWLEKLSDRDFY